MTSGNPRWQNGVSGNPHGRPKNAFAFATRVREILAQTDAEDLERRDNLTLILLKAVDQAKQGNHDARMFLASYGYGKPVDRVELTSAEDFESLDADAQTRALVELVEQAQAVIAHRMLVLPAPEKVEEDDR